MRITHSTHNTHHIGGENTKSYSNTYPDQVRSCVSSHKQSFIMTQSLAQILAVIFFVIHLFLHSICALEAINNNNKGKRRQAIFIKARVKPLLPVNASLYIFGVR